MKAGKVEKQIDRAIRLNPTLLLVLSEHSVESDWVRWEVEQARRLEKETGQDILCPVALDASWKTCKWPGPLRSQIEDYNVLDFSEWRDDVVLDRQPTSACPRLSGSAACGRQDRHGAGASGGTGSRLERDPRLCDVAWDRLPRGRPGARRRQRRREGWPSSRGLSRGAP